MVVIWLIVLIIYGCVNSFASIGALEWFLLIPLALEDSYTSGLSGQIKALKRR